MNNKLIIITFCLFFIMFIVGCTTVTRSSTTDNITPSLQLSGGDITVGEVLTAELKYNANDDTLKEKLIAEALRGTTYDFLLAPRYDIITTKSGTRETTVMRVRGRGARLK